ncbi:cAMP-dependent protein kinase type II-beta regulatory subunit [Cichlidogyrus casuarinus]|uniref:cAMP-dependent protein kinase type II-beta regulatory subunit n=1 Tax=Cichlidogyrus casuarinus TaxID=1844966 RepID=A0ABD2PQ99_9PLAT
MDEYLIRTALLEQQKICCGLRIKLSSAPLMTSFIRRLIQLPRRLSDSIIPSHTRFSVDVAAEAFDPSKEASDDEAESSRVTPKTDEQRARLNQAVNRILLFKCLDEVCFLLRSATTSATASSFSLCDTIPYILVMSLQTQMNQVIDAMAELRVSERDQVIGQGEDGDNFYVIEKGTFDVYTNSNNNNAEGEMNEHGLKIGSYVDKGSFGELALMYNTPRAATIIARYALPLLSYR